MIFETYDDILTIEAVASALKLGVSKVYQLVQSGSLKAFKAGKDWKVSKLALIDYVIEQHGTVSHCPVAFSCNLRNLNILIIRLFPAFSLYFFESVSESQIRYFHCNTDISNDREKRDSIYTSARRKGRSYIFVLAIVIFPSFPFFLKIKHHAGACPAWHKL